MMSANEVATIDIDGILISHSIEGLADAINSEYQQFEEVSKRGLLHFRNVGEGLLKARELCGYGQWLPWLSTNCPAIAERTAQAAIRIARNWGTIESKSATVADLTINEALKLIPPKLPEMNARYADWYDYAADAVWRTRGNAQAFRDAITIPDIMDKLTTDQIVPLAQAIFKDLTLKGQLSGENEFTTYRITAEVKRRFKEAFEKNAEEKYRERKLEEPRNKLVREYREFEVAAKKANISLMRINSLKTNNHELHNVNCGFAESGFHIAKHELKLTLQERGIKVVTEDNIPTFVELPQLPEMIKDIPAIEEQSDFDNSIVSKAYALWQQMNELQKDEFQRLTALKV